MISTLLATGALDLNQFAWYRRLCLSALNSRPLAFFASSSPISGQWSFYESTLYLTDDTGSLVCPVLDDHLSIRTIAWSPDGHRLALTAFQQLMGQEMFVVDLNSLQARPIARLVQNPIWSPDNRHIVALEISNTFGNSRWALFDVDGTEHFTLNAFENASPVWLPDGQSVLYTGTNGTGIYQTDVHGNVKQINQLNCTDPVWSPDATHVLCLGAPLSPGFSRFVMKVDGSDSYNFGEWSMSESWSPDSQWVTFVRGDMLQRLDVNSGVLTTIYNAPQMGGIQWSPDSHMLAIGQHSQSTIAQPNYNSVVHIFNANGSDDQTLVPGYPIAWSPNSQALLIWKWVDPKQQLQDLEIVSVIDGIVHPVHIKDGILIPSSAAWEPISQGS